MRAFAMWLTRLSPRLWAVGLLVLAFGAPGCARFRGADRDVPNMWPLEQGAFRITSSFGPRDGRQHNGIDLAAPAGTPVHATANGQVSFSGQQRGYGNIVVVDHAEGLATVYGHLRKRKVGRGEPVRRGQQVGEVGRTGNATGNHLHYEVRRNGRAVDPVPYLP